MFASFSSLDTLILFFNMKEIPKKKSLSLEEIETRIHLYRDESRTISHRVDALSDRRKEINIKIKELKEMAIDLKGQ